MFPSPRGLVRDLKIDAVPHGFRSSFRDWAAERIYASRDVCEIALAHVNTDRVEAAYRRTDLFDRRHQTDGRLGRVRRLRQRQSAEAGPRAGRAPGYAGRVPLTRRR